MLGLKISRSGELTAGRNEPFWWLIALTAKNVSLSQTACALSLQQCMPAEMRWLPYLVAGGIPVMSLRSLQEAGDPAVPGSHIGPC